ncbi:MAG: Uma2 family endonuclease [Chloroflexi bacterium]|nr:Uma2 family endonuclease [Chloroflexota bacterium]
MVTEVAERLMSAEEFLEWESAQPFRHELIDNRIYPMPGGSSSHEIIISALVGWFYFALIDRIDHVYAGIQVMADAIGTYTYPDVTVVLGEPVFHGGAKSGLLENPTFLFEVSSPSTEKIDRTRKLDQYLQIPSLEAYFLVSQDTPLVEAYTRSGDEWTYSRCAGLDSYLRIPSLNDEIPLAFIYSKVKFEPDQNA